MSNLAKLQTWVAFKRSVALTKPDPDAFLMEAHDWLGSEMNKLAAAETPKHLAGLTAWDLAEAQLVLIKPVEEGVS
jgi:hypothetical protein